MGATAGGEEGRRGGGEVEGVRSGEGEVSIIHNEKRLSDELN